MEASLLENARKEIDDVDREMALLFARRMAAVKDVAAYKAERGLPIFDAEREKRVLQKNAARLEDAALKAYYVSFLQGLMDISKTYQADLLSGMKVAYCGVKGAYAHIAAKRIFPFSRPVEYPGFAEAYAAVENGETPVCVLPIENSYAGEVGEVLDLMFRGPLQVRGVYSLPIRHCLLGKPGAKLEDVKTVLSHPQAIMQCASYLHDRGLAAVAATNTAVAAETVAKGDDLTVAAIASADSAALFGLEILDHDVNASLQNTTRFAVFSRAGDDRPALAEGFILLFTLHSEVGALAKAVNVISANGFDMRVLRSRPVRDVPWQYYFYVEAVGDPASDEGKRMLRALSVVCDELKVAGLYSREGDLAKKEAAL